MLDSAVSGRLLDSWLDFWTLNAPTAAALTLRARSFITRSFEHVRLFSGAFRWASAAPRRDSRLNRVHSCRHAPTNQSPLHTQQEHVKTPQTPGARRKPAQIAFSPSPPASARPIGPIPIENTKESGLRARRRLQLDARHRQPRPRRRRRVVAARPRRRDARLDVPAPSCRREWPCLDQQTLTPSPTLYGDNTQPKN